MKPHHSRFVSIPIALAALGVFFLNPLPAKAADVGKSPPGGLKLTGLSLPGGFPSPIILGMNVSVFLKTDKGDQPPGSPLSKEGSWKSSDEKILGPGPGTTSLGVFVAKADGSATVTFSHSTAGTASLTVNVKAPEAKLMPANPTIKVGRSITFGVSLDGRFPEDGARGPGLSSSDPGVIALDPNSLSLVAKKPGTATITFAPGAPYSPASTKVTVDTLRFPNRLKKKHSNSVHVPIATVKLEFTPR